MTPNRTRQPQREPSLSDTELMDRVRAGDRLAFKEIYTRHGGRVYAYLWRMTRDGEAAEDLRQEAFIRLWEARAKWADRGSVVGYLLRVARNLALNASNSSQTRERLTATFASRPSPIPKDPDAILEQRQLQQRVSDAVDALPTRAREVFTLKRDAGLSHKEIAELLGISNKTVEAHMGRSYALLRDALADALD